MKRIPCSHLALVALASLACAASLQAQTATVKTIHDFGTTSVASIANVSPNAAGPGPNGARPAASVIDGGDGYLYGTTKTGGTNEYGTIYRTNIATGDTAVLYSFINDGDSAYPEAGLVKVGAAFYGAARGDQFDDKGSIFRITPPATATGAAVFETLQIFSGARSGPAEPRGTLVLGQDGRLYGTSVSGGSSNGGTVYSFVPGPAPITVSLTHQFTTFGDGYAPVAGLVTDGEGSFYGVTCRSNSGSSVNIYGTVFSINVNDGVAFSTIYTFTGGVDGAQPCDDLVLGVDGVLYGTTTSGGFSDLTGEGTVFRITTNGVFTSLYSFTDFSDGPPNGLVLGPDGNFYGSSEGLPVGDPFFSPGLRALNPGPGDGTAGTLFRITTDGALVNLYSFSGRGTPNDGARPYGSLLYTGGYFYGVTYAGGLSNAANLGTLFQADVFGAITLGASALTVSESAGYATVEFDRVGGSGGPATVTYSTADGTAKAGSDYTMSNGRVNWADGDAAPKTVLVPIINDTVAEPTETFQLGLSTVGETAVRFNIVSPLTITITDDDSTSAPTPTPSPTPIPTPTPTPTPTPAPSPTPTPTPTPPPSAQPSITLTSPPTDVTINSGVTLPLIASVVDPGSALARVQFLINGVPFGQLGADAPYVFNATSLAAGAYQIQAIATDKYGRQSTSAARTVTVAAPDPAHPSPEAAIVTDLNGRAFLAGSIVPVTSTAKTPDAGDALARVDFYADGVVFASFDGSGAPLTSSGRAPITRAADSPFGAGSVFTANFQMPGTDRLVSMIAVALTKLGRTQVSAPVTLQSVKTTVDKPPVVKIGSPDKGNRVRTKTVVNIPVTATDPDAATPNAITRGPNRRAFDSSGLISRLEYYLNNLKVKDATEAPLGYTVAPPAAGAYVLQAIATDGGGLSTVSDPVMLEAYDPTIVTITPVGLLDVNEGERKGKAFINRAGGDLSGPLTVYYSIGGTATNGVDYVGLDGQPLSGSIVIPAGESNVRLKFHPQTDSVAEGAENVKIKLQASPSGDYDLGSLVKVKINIHDAP